MIRFRLPDRALSNVRVAARAPALTQPRWQPTDVTSVINGPYAPPRTFLESAGGLPVGVATPSPASRAVS
jgi:hypothetical protein